MLWARTAATAAAAHAAVASAMPAQPWPAQPATIGIDVTATASKTPGNLMYGFSTSATLATPGRPADPLDYRTATFRRLSVPGGTGRAGPPVLMRRT